MEQIYEVPNDEIEAVAEYWFELLEEGDITYAERSLALSYLALYSALKEIEHSDIDLSMIVPASTSIH